MGVLVLIVDDDERNAKLARDVLEQAGMRTLIAATAQQGIDLARTHQPDVVLVAPVFAGERRPAVLAQ